MKKLMIAAAAAAMICGAEAVDYKFTAKLHTTVGENGEDVFARDAANLGRNDSGFWYNDPALLAECTSTGTDRDWTDAAKAKYPNLYWVIGQSSTGKAYPKLAIRTRDLSAQYGDDNKAVPMLYTTDEIKLIKDLADAYNQQSYDQWCGEYVWWTVSLKDCYRVYAADDIVADITIANDCCEDAKGYFQLTDGSKPCVIFKDGLFNRFGAQTADKAFLYEIFAQVTNLTMKASGLAFNGYLAGQGFRDEDDYPTELHGRVVGYTEAPSCVDKDCCVDDVKTGALAFECNWSTTPDKTLRTAANGEFRIVRK